MHSADITFVIITKNEAANIAACLRSLPSSASALVFDALSDDGTADIARSLGAIVMQAPWWGYVKARAAAAAEVKTAWTFMLDADERLTPELTRELEALQPPEGMAGYSVPRRNHFCGRWIRSAGWWPDRLVRLMRTGHATLTSRGNGAHAVHETWQLREGRGELSAPIDHFSYTSVSDYRRKFALYTGLEAQAGDVGLSGVIAAWLTVPVRFSWFMLRRGGVLEGWRGAYVCAGSSLYPAVVATKSRRRRSASRHPTL